MSSAGNAFSQTLQEITTTKLDELSKRYSAFEEKKLAVLSSLQGVTDPIERLRHLSAGVKHCLSIKIDRSGAVLEGASRHPVEEKKLKNFDRFFTQAQYDPSVPPELVRDWEEALLRRLDMQSLKFQYASLYGKLVTEWLSLDHGFSRKRTLPDDASEPATKKAKIESRQAWQDLVFTNPGVDGDRMTQYLRRLFGAGNAENCKVVDALQKLRRSVEDFEMSLSRPGQFTKENLTWAINGLLSSGLVTGEDLDLLKSFKSNPVVLAEIADVLNMRLAALDSWSWGDAVKLEQKRKISGIYNIHMREDILQALFLQFIGVKWSVFLKRAFNQFRRTGGAWKPMGRDVPPETLRRLQHFLAGSVRTEGSLRQVREDIYGKRYFVAHLLDQEFQGSGGEEGEEEVQYAVPAVAQASQQAQPMVMQQRAVNMQAQPMAKRKAAPSSWSGPGMPVQSAMGPTKCSGQGSNRGPDDDDEELNSPMALKQKLLHLLATEIDINTRLHGELTALHFVFRDWNPLLPHETVLAVLEFFGVSPIWRNFFAKFLQAPLKWADSEDGEEARTRQRGTPASHALSDVFGEVVLFCLDVAVNRETGGNVLWRVHDDAWFWSPNHEDAVKAWATVNSFVDAAGVSVDTRKAGTVRVAQNPDVTLPIDESLPRSAIRWGFLSLSPQTGRFEIDQDLVDAHMAELRRQLLQGGEKSVFSLVQTWNSYAATFFSSNFGVPANCFGRGHVDRMLETHNRVQRGVFAEEEGVSNVADYLRKLLRERFGVEGATEGFFYFPAELGGLDLKSPFISLLQIRDSVPASSDGLFESLFRSEREAYETARSNYISSRTAAISRGMPSGGGGPNLSSFTPPPAASADNSPNNNNAIGFLSFEEYVAYREEFNFNHAFQISNVFWRLMAKPEEQSIDMSDDFEISEARGMVERLLAESPGRARKFDNYLKWVLMMYGPEVCRRFGGLSIVEQGLLPMGMVSIFKESKVEWRG
ncbi:hypothetical protein VUR80DRAFT_8005 [Thermomyces stellatus]